MNFFYLFIDVNTSCLDQISDFIASFYRLLKHSCNLSSVKGDPPLKKKKEDKQTVTEQQNNLMSPASPGRIHQILNKC